MSKERRQVSRTSGESEIEDDAMRGFMAAVAEGEATRPTWCAGWSAHEVVAHVTAAAEERANLIDDHLAGLPSRSTRSWDVREPPFRALPDAVLRERLVVEAARFERVVSAMDDQDAIEYTGWFMTADRLRTHSRSEASLHRWDLVGDDELSSTLLSDPALTRHALAVFAGMPALLEARRWIDAPFSPRPMGLRSPSEPDVLITPGEGLSLVRSSDADEVIEMVPSERLLVLWGRCPAQLRHPEGNAEIIDDLLRRPITDEP
jgi:hypothetical protein